MSARATKQPAIGQTALTLSDGALSIHASSTQTAKPATCLECPHMKPNSSFDGKHLFCNKFRKWTNTLDARWLGHCMDEWESEHD